MDAAIREALQSRADAPVNYYAEYLESEDVSRGSRRRWHFVTTSAGSSRAARIDVVVANATPALQFVLRFREELFPRVPVVFLAGRIPEAIARHKATGITGVLSDAALAETLELALKLHPSVKRVFVVAQSPTVEGYDERVRAALSRFSEPGRAHLHQREVAAWPPCRRQGDIPSRLDSLRSLHASRHRGGRLF